MFSWAGSSPRPFLCRGEEKIDWDKELTLIKDLIIETKLEYKDVSPTAFDTGGSGGVIDSLGILTGILRLRKRKRSLRNLSWRVLRWRQPGAGNGVCKEGADPGNPAEKAGVLSGDSGGRRWR